MLACPCKRAVNIGKYPIEKLEKIKGFFADGEILAV
jgi:hypothetical protein